MKRAAIVDSCTIIHLLSTSGAEAHRKHARQHVAKIIADGGTILVPAVVIAELHYDGVEGSKYLEKFGMLAVGALRVVPLNQTAADIAGRMRAAALASRRKESGDPRGAVLYDALIAATAVAQKVATLLTANSHDYAPLFKAVGATIEIVDTRNPPKGQAPLFPDLPDAPKRRSKK